MPLRGVLSIRLSEKDPWSSWFRVGQRREAAEIAAMRRWRTDVVDYMAGRAQGRRKATGMLGSTELTLASSKPFASWSEALANKNRSGDS